MGFAPFDLGKAQVKVAHGAAGGDIRKIEEFAGAPAFFAELFHHRFEAAEHLLFLTLDPLRALLRLWPLLLDVDRSGSV